MADIQRIKALAHEKGLKIKYLCAQLGLSETYLSNVQNGRDRMTEERLEKIAELLNTTTAYLQGTTDEKGRPEKHFLPNSLLLYDERGLLLEKRLSREQVDLICRLLNELK